jgi:hypothetical protein
MCGKSDSQISLKAPAFAPRGGGGAEARADWESHAAAEGPEAGGAYHAAEAGPGAGGSQAGHAAGAEELPAPWSPHWEGSHPPAQLWRPRFQSADL